MASLVFSPGVKVACDAPVPPAHSVDGELILTRFASTKLDFGSKLQCGSEAVQQLLLRNESADQVSVSFRANRQAAKLLGLPEPLHVDAGCTEHAAIKFTPESLGNQRVQFEVVTSTAGRLTVQLFASVVCEGATAAVTRALAQDPHLQTLPAPEVAKKVCDPFEVCVKVISSCGFLTKYPQSMPARRVTPQ